MRKSLSDVHKLLSTRRNTEVRYYILPKTATRRAVEVVVNHVRIASISDSQRAKLVSQGVLVVTAREDIPDGYIETYEVNRTVLSKYLTN